MSGKKRLKKRGYCADKLPDLLDGRHYRELVATPKILKHYAENDVVLHVHFGLRTGELETAQFCAVFYRADESVVSAVDDAVIPGADFELVCLRTSDDDVEQLVFVPNIETVQKPEGVLVSGLRLVARLQAIEDVHRRLIRAFHLSWTSGLVFGGVEENGELGPYVRSFSVGKHKLIDEKIESGDYARHLRRLLPNGAAANSRFRSARRDLPIPARTSRQRHKGRAHSRRGFPCSDFRGALWPARSWRDIPQGDGSWLREWRRYEDSSRRFLAQRALAALRAISDLCSGVSFAARALPPLRPPSFPSATAAGFFSSAMYQF